MKLRYVALLLAVAILVTYELTLQLTERIKEEIIIDYVEKVCPSRTPMGSPTVGI